MNAHSANGLFHAIKATFAPLDVLETEARNRWPDVATASNGLRVLYRIPRGLLYVPPVDPSPTYSYQWGDAEVSRNEAARRLGAA